MADRRRRRARRQRNPNALVDPALRNLSREEEILHSQKHLDPTIKGILDQLAQASESEALELALQLQKSIRGDAALLNRPEASDLVSKLRGEAAGRDEAAAKYEENKSGFVQFYLDRAERLIKKTGSEADEVKAQVSKEFHEKVNEAKGRRGAARARLEYLLEHSPKEDVEVASHVVMTRQGQSIIPVVFGEQVNMRHLKFYFKPGRHTVPKPIADILRQRTQIRLETAAREKALQSSGEENRDVNVFGKWHEIDREFGVQTDSPEAVGVM